MLSPWDDPGDDSRAPIPQSLSSKRKTDIIFINGEQLTSIGNWRDPEQERKDQNRVWTGTTWFYLYHEDDDWVEDSETDKEDKAKATATVATAPATAASSSTAPAPMTSPQAPTTLTRLRSRSRERHHMPDNDVPSETEAESARRPPMSLSM